MVFSMSLPKKILFFNYQDNIFMKIYKINGHKHDDILFSWFIVCCGCVGAINLAKLAPSMSRLIDYLRHLFINLWLARRYILHSYDINWPNWWNNHCKIWT